MLAEAGDSGEGLPTLLTLDLHPAVGVHALVPAQVGELGVALEANLTPGIENQCVTLVHSYVKPQEDSRTKAFLML